MKSIKCIVLVCSIFFAATFVQAEEVKKENVVEDSPIWVNAQGSISEEAFEKLEKGTTCTYEGTTYSKGQTICKNKTVHKCGSNGWFVINKSC